MSGSSAFDAPQPFDDLIRADLAESEETARAYLRQSWLARATTALWDMRCTAGLTQAQVAERLGTTQSAVARWERDSTGSISFHRYVDFALACGMLPMDIEFRPLGDMRTFAAAHPESPRTTLVYELSRPASSIASRQSEINEFAGLWPNPGTGAPMGGLARPLEQEFLTDHPTGVESATAPPLLASSRWYAATSTLAPETQQSQQGTANSQSVA